MSEEKTAAICKTCNRVVWSTDVDAAGNCTDHKKPEAKQPKSK